MPRVFISHRVRDADRWRAVAEEVPVESVGAITATRFVSMDDPSRTAVLLEYPEGSDARLLATAVGELPGMDALLARLGVIPETIEIYVEGGPRETGPSDAHHHGEGPEPG